MFFSLGGAANENAVDRGAPPWSDLLVPSFARSVRIKNGEQAIMAEPNGAAFRRGTAALAARLPLFGARRGGGCRGAWLLVGPQAWLCDEHADYIADLPVDAAQPAVFARHDGLPYRYFFAGPGGSFAYRGLGEVDFGEPAMTLEAGFAVAVDHERIVGGERFGYTRRGLWVPMRDFGDAQPSDFRGEEIVETPPGLIPFGWVIADRSPYYRRVGASFVAAGRVGALLRRVDVLERSANLGGGAFLRIDGDTWMRERDVRRPTLAPPPDEEEIAHGARWLDIELATQTLVAYEGARPVFATLVSTGKGKKPGHPFETPKGVHRIWVKLVSTVMDNLENENAASYYRIEDVPYVQFFSKGVGLHAVFWHRRFGFERSHGCVNLAPHDAARLFHFTGPHVPAGWSAALPSRFDPGTIVRVR
ncbi:MAG: murein L,D-transpeptidase [Myxococcales bacterium]|nr:murein L,D-transpeptidase [Myxococcales bacterium]